MKIENKADHMKKILFLLFLCMQHTHEFYAMDLPRYPYYDTREVIREKYNITQGLITKQNLARTFELNRLRRRCSSNVSWPEVEKNILVQIKRIDLLCNLAEHTALKLLKSESIIFKVRDTDDLVIKQDLFCVDCEATMAAPVFQVESRLMKICKDECYKAMNAILKIVRTLEFLPDDINIDEFFSDERVNL